MSKNMMLKTAAVTILEQNTKIAELLKKVGEKDNKIESLEVKKEESDMENKKSSIADDIVSILSKKKDMSDEEKADKKRNLISDKTISELENYLQALKDTSFVSEGLGKVASPSVPGLDVWDKTLLKNY